MNIILRTWRSILEAIDTRLETEHLYPFENNDLVVPDPATVSGKRVMPLVATHRHRCMWHRHVVYGVGGMGDGYVCLACGLESYHFPPNRTVVADLNNVDQEELEKVWWPRIEMARMAPGGIVRENTRVRTSDDP